MIRAAPRAPSRHPNRSLSTAASLCGVSVALGLKRVRVDQVTFAEQVTFGAAGGRGGAQHEARKGLGNRAHAGGARGERGGAASCFPPTLCRTHLLSLSLPHISTHTYTPALSLFAHTHAHARTHPPPPPANLLATAHVVVCARAVQVPRDMSELREVVERLQAPSPPHPTAPLIFIFIYLLIFLTPAAMLFLSLFPSRPRLPLTPRRS